jgi:hypothetical protein
MESEFNLGKQRFFEPLESIFRHAWIDHAHKLALFYTGVNALKTEYYMRGRVTYWSMTKEFQIIV